MREKHHCTAALLSELLLALATIMGPVISAALISVMDSAFNIRSPLSGRSKVF